METVWGKLIIFFEDPFWVGIFQRVSEGELTACKVTFGGEPRDQEVYQFVLDHYAALRYSPGLASGPKGDPSHRNRDQVPAGAPASAGGGQGKQKGRRSGESGGGEGTSFCTAAGEKAGEAEREIGFTFD